MPDIAEQLDRAIGAAPSDAPALEPTLALGRRAVRRRRLAYGAGAVATALFIGGTAWAVSPSDPDVSRPHGPEIADGNGVDAGPHVPSPSEPAPDPGAPWYGPDGAKPDGNGRLFVRPGWRVLDTVTTASGHVIGAAVAKGSRQQWFLWGDAMTIGSLHAPEPGYPTFTKWVQVNRPLLETEPPGSDNDDGDWPGVPRDDLVAFGQGETLTALPGATIVEQRPSPAIGENFARPGDLSAVALVTVEGGQLYVLARSTPDAPDQFIAVKKAEGGEDLDAFLTFARERYAEGGGGLL